MNASPHASDDANPGQPPAQDPQTPDLGSGQPNEPAEGPRDGNDQDKASDTDKVPSTHVPDKRAFDL